MKSQHSREFLLLTRDHISVNSIPNHLRTNAKKRSIRTNRKRGSKGGFRRRPRRLKDQLPLPVTLLINARPLKAKTDELTANIRTSTGPHASWPSQRHGRTATSRPAGCNPSDSLLRTDRKSRGGGVCLLIREERCPTAAVRNRPCVCLQPVCLPREFIWGDFNSRPLKKCPSTYYQYVDCPSRKNKFL